MRAAQGRIVAAQDDARRRIARDLHDGAQQKIVAALVTLQRAQGKWSSDPQRAHELLDTGVEQAKAGLNSLRELVVGIHPPILTHLGLAAAIESLAAGMPVPVRMDIMSDRLPASFEASIYFFVAEGLTNVIKHAEASEAGVRIGMKQGNMRVETTDDGIGGADPTRAGLAGLSDRVEALGGQMTVSSPPGHGTTLTACIPLPAPLATR
jgi:signal transduction histidine kinase